jgi:hypothetical protein
VAADETEVDSLLVPFEKEDARESNIDSLVVPAEELRCAMEATTDRGEVRAVIVSFLRNT